jgi:hypothetical protein
MVFTRRMWVLLGLTLALAVPASAVAASGYVVHPSDPSYGYVRPSDQQTYWACDLHVDGHRARLHFRNEFMSPGNYLTSYWAPSQGCTAPARSWGWIVEFRICVENEGCSAWKR